MPAKKTPAPAMIPWTLDESRAAWEALCARCDEGRALRNAKKLAAARGEAIDYSSWERRTLRHLVASGRITLDEVEAACIAAEDEDGD